VDESNAMHTARHETAYDVGKTDL